MACHPFEMLASPPVTSSEKTRAALMVGYRTASLMIPVPEPPSTWSTNASSIGHEFIKPSRPVAGLSIGPS